MRPEGFYCTKEPLTIERLRKDAQENGGILCHFFFQYYPDRTGSEEENHLNDKLWELKNYSDEVRRQSSSILKAMGFVPGEVAGYLDVIYG